jgi:Na+-transporting NADH:ubiquinone oxidoreductase subunit B
MIGYIPGSIGETSFIAIMLGAGLLLYTGIASWKIIFSFFAGGLAIGYLLNAVSANPVYGFKSASSHHAGWICFWCSIYGNRSGYRSSNINRKIYLWIPGRCNGIVIRVLNPAFPEGVMMAILSFKRFAPLIDHYVIQSNVKRRLKRLKTA